jgi:hypothetical protein
VINRSTIEIISYHDAKYAAGHGVRGACTPNEPTTVGLCVQGILVINKISNLQIPKY